ncbi:MAG TPA: methylated-DNA--[protein]-cysteine S-methyltransferase [Xanthomonadales bacterium]|nr:methylated-DNA--[protein]-cysteine S-methyltransferase [Xanthomonadales bacterium]
MWFDEMPSPVGTLLLAADDAGVRHIRFERERHPMRREGDWVRDPARLAYVRAQLDEYFAGARRTFDLPLAPRGSDFQLRVWQALRAIPWGRTVSYSEVARRIGELEAVRAVGAANGRNPLPIVVPCHRVIGADGSLVGFGGGLGRKRWLLAHEGAVPEAVGDLFAP